MDQFALMVDTLTDYTQKQIDDWNKSEDESMNESMALVESTLLHGYTIKEVTECKPTWKRVWEKESV